MKTKYEYKYESFDRDVYDEWKEYKLSYLKESWILNKIYYVENFSSDYNNIFEWIIPETFFDFYAKDNTIRIQAEDLEEYDGIKYFDFDFEYKTSYHEEEELSLVIDHKWNEAEPLWLEEDDARDILKSRLIFIDAKWYSQWEYMTYCISVYDASDVEEVTEALQFITELFTISEKEVILYARKVMTVEWETFFNEWEEFDWESSRKEFVDTDDLIDIINKRQHLEWMDIPHELIT